MLEHLTENQKVMGWSSTIMRCAYFFCAFIFVLFKFLWLRSGMVVAVASLARDPVAAQVAEVFRLGKSISKHDALE